MQLEEWREHILSPEDMTEVRKFLYSLPRSIWATAREWVPFSLVKVTAPAGMTAPNGVPVESPFFAVIVDYAEVSSSSTYVIAAVLEKDGTLKQDVNGRLMVAVANPKLVELVANCGQLTKQWMARNLCDS